MSRIELLAGIVSALQVGLSNPLENLAGDVLFPFETLAVDIPTPDPDETQWGNVG